MAVQRLADEIRKPKAKGIKGTKASGSISTTKREWRRTCRNNEVEITRKVVAGSERNHIPEKVKDLFM